MKKQTERILQHMLDHGGITTLEAYNLYGATRLSARIKELKEMHHITSERIAVENRYGSKCHVSRYSLILPGERDA